MIDLALFLVFAVAACASAVSVGAWEGGLAVAAVAAIVTVIAIRDAFKDKR